jgi:hypothetical protein
MGRVKFHHDECCALEKLYTFIDLKGSTHFGGLGSFGLSLK